MDNRNNMGNPQDFQNHNNRPNQPGNGNQPGGNRPENGNQPGGNRPGQGGSGGNGKKPGQPLLVKVILAALMLFVGFRLINMAMPQEDAQEITYTEFIQMVEEDKVEAVTTSDYVIEIYLKSDVEDGSILGLMMDSSDQPDLYTGMVGDEEELKNYLTERGVEIKGYIPSDGNLFLEIFLSLFPFLLLIGFYAFIFKKQGGGMMGSFGKSNAKVYVQHETGVTFKDVAGQDEAEESLVEIVDFLHNPGRYSKIGAKLPKGALLVGPPGTGKTLLAKAVAGEAHVPFFSLSGSDFVEMFVGMGASRVRDLFKQAQQNAPCIIFIDEIDAIGKSRDTRYGGDSEREQTLNQLLAEMDGFDSAKGVFILAATNRPEVLDKALLRPGRFDRRIIVERPDLKGRIAILKVHAKGVHMDDTVDLEAIALATSGAVGSDLANMINEAAINAVKNGRDVVCQADLFEAVEQVLVGKEKKDRIMGEEERRIVSYHEVGHALISALQKDAEPVQKITIVPRTMGALGYVMNVPEEEKFMNTKAELKAMLVQFLAGRAAEELIFDTVTNGAANDIEKATAIARAMVTQYGMSDEFGLMGLESVESRYLDGRPVMHCADRTAAQIDDVVKEMLREAYAQAKELLSQNLDALHKIAAYLIKKETITGKEFMEIYRNVLREREGGEAVEVEDLVNMDTMETSENEGAMEKKPISAIVMDDDSIVDV